LQDWLLMSTLHLTFEARFHTMVVKVYRVKRILSWVLYDVGVAGREILNNGLMEGMSLRNRP
jgi:hypothetical protein